MARIHPKQVINASRITPLILLGLLTTSILQSAAADKPPSAETIGSALRTDGIQGADVQVVTGKNGHKFYHLRYLLTPANCELSISNQARHPRYSGSNAYTFEKGGQFEVFIRYSDFPVVTETPDNKPEFMILRMLYTSPDQPNADHKIANKRKLFERIQQMKTDAKGSVEVIIELDKVNVVSEQPLSVRMKGINLFFRHAFGSYIDYTGPLKGQELEK